MCCDVTLPVVCPVVPVATVHVDDGDVVTVALQQQRRGETADPGADHNDVDVDVTSERCERRRVGTTDPDR